MEVGVVVMLFFGIVGYWKYSNIQIDKKIKAKRDAEFNELKGQFVEIEQDVIKACERFNFFLNFENGYFNNYKLRTWQDDTKVLHNKIIEDGLIKLLKLSTAPQILKEFIFNYNSGSDLRKKYNQNFIKNELITYSSLFDDIKGNSLDKQQRLAIVKDEDCQQIIAGAGSGKTTTIIGKVKYLFERYQVSSNEILLMSFTKKSVNDLTDRIENEKIDARTFHSLGHRIVQLAENKKPSILSPSEFSVLLKKIFEDKVKDSIFLKNVNEYIINFLKSDSELEDFNSRKEELEFIKNRDIKRYSKSINSKNGLVTYNRELVKSVQECEIANFLFFNQVEYQYEFPYPFDNLNPDYKKYRPDFTIITPHGNVYLEHFGIDESGNVPVWFKNQDETYSTANNKYKEGMVWKRKWHSENNTKLLETYSYDFNSGDIFNKLKSLLKNEGVQLRPYSEEEKWKIINEADNNAKDSLIEFVGTFINLLKSNRLNFDVLKSKFSDNSIYIKKRTQKFLEICEVIYIEYQQSLSVRQVIDFNDLINKATDYLERDTVILNYKYIIIDEFQDTSVSRSNLIKELQRQNPESKLFCVGDDWQSIYRFTGCDIGLFVDFEKHFGYTEKSLIETTYRFGDPLLTLSSGFILKNPNQSRKNLKATQKRSLFEIVSYQKDGRANLNFQHTIISILDNLGKDTIEEKSILFIGRYNFDNMRFSNRDSNSKYQEGESEFFKVIYEDDGECYILYKLFNTKIKFLTAHRAKGLEADIVISINNDSGHYGFPSQISDDEILNLLLSNSDHFENGEERRLFYVTLTRAKEKVYLICDSTYKSSFITEIQTVNTSLSKLCPKCGQGEVVFRRSGVSQRGNEYSMFGCTNYSLGCGYVSFN